nr:hypothetical protein [Mesorhizobium sp.]
MKGLWSIVVQALHGVILVQARIVDRYARLGRWRLRAIFLIPSAIALGAVFALYLLAPINWRMPILPATLGLVFVAGLQYGVAWEIIGEVSNPLGAMPGAAIQKFLRFAIPKRAFDGVFAQTFADFEIEYFDALDGGRTWLARWRWLQLWITIGITVLLWMWAAVGKRLYELWKVS